MSDIQKEVELIIKGTNLSKKSTAEVAKSLQDVGKSLEAQRAAAKNGQLSIAELDKAMRKLKEVGDSIATQQAAISHFEKLANQYDLASKKAKDATEAHKKYRDEISKDGPPTKSQSVKADKLGVAEQRANKGLDSASNALNRAKHETDALGISTKNLASAQSQVLASAQNYKKVFDDMSSSMRTLKTESDAVKAAQEVANNAASGEKAAQNAKLAAAAQKEFTTSMQQLGQNSIDTAAKMDKYAHSVDGAKLKNYALTTTIKELISPSTAAKQSLSQLESSVTKLNAEYANAKKPISDYKAKLSELKDVQKSLTERAELMDGLRRQNENLAKASAEYAKAKKEVLGYANAVKALQNPNAELVNKLAQADVKLAASAQRMRDASTAAGLYKDSLRKAGVDTNNLASSASRLENVARQSASAINNLNTAYHKHGEAVNKSKGSMGAFRDEGRTTLSLLQRIRGEVLALATAYMGLHGIIGIAKNAINSFKDLQAMQIKLELISDGDKQKAADTFEYIRSLVKHVGLDLKATADAYADFAMASKMAGFNQKQTNYIFERFAEAMRVQNKTVDEQKGVWKALEQMMSKGQIMAEELKLQLGDRFVGVMGLMAKAIDVPTGKLMDMMKKGEIGADRLLDLARVIEQEFASSLDQSMASVAANEERLRTAFFEWQQLLAGAGLTDAYNNFIIKLTEFFQSDTGHQFAVTLGEAFTTLIEILTWCVENFETLKIVIETLIAIQAARWVTSFGAALIALPAKIDVAIAAINGMSGAVKYFRLALGVLTAGLIGWQIGKIFYQKYEVVRQVTVWLVSNVVGAWEYLKTATANSWLAIAGLVSSGISMAMGKALSLLSRGLSAAANMLSMIPGMGDVAGQLRSAAGAAGWQAYGHTMQGLATRGAMQSKISANAGAYRQTRDILNKAAEELVLDIADPNHDAVSNPFLKTEYPEGERPNLYDDGKKKGKGGGGKKGKGGGKKGKSDAEKEAEDRVKLAEEVEDALTKIEEKIGKKQKLSLEERLKAIDLEYSKLYKKIEQLGGDDGAKQKARLDGYIQELKKLENEKYNKDAMADAEKKVNDLLKERDQLIDTLKKKAEAGLMTEMDMRQQIAQIVAKSKPDIIEAADAAIAFAQSLTNLDPKVLEQFIVNMELVKAKAIEVKDALFQASTINKDLADGGVATMKGLAEGLAGAITGANSLGDAFRNAGEAFLNFAANFLMKIAEMIAQAMILYYLQSAFGGMSGGVGGAISGALNNMMSGRYHTGGIVGRTRGSSTFNGAIFANAPRYHTGGIVGLSPSEYPAILQKNEEVLTTNDPRHAFNNSQGQDSSPVNLKVINTINPVEMLDAALTTPEGERVLLNAISKKGSTIKKAIDK